MFSGEPHHQRHCLRKPRRQPDTPEGVAEVASAMFDDAIPMMDDLANQWLLLHQARLVDPDYALFPILTKHPEVW